LEGKLLLIAIIVILLLIGSLYAYFGFRKSVKRGIRNICVLVGVSMLSLIAAAVFPVDLVVTPIADYIKALLDDILDTELLSGVLTLSITNAVKTAVIGSVYIVLFLIAAIVTAIYDLVKKPDTKPSGKKHTFTALIGSAAAGIYLTAFALFAPPVNIASEADNIADALIIVKNIQNAAANDYAAYLLNAEALVRIFIDTNFIAADVNEKIDLVNALLKSAASNMKDPVLSVLLSNIQYNNADELQNDARQITLVMQRLYDAGITDLMNGNLSEAVMRKIRDYADKQGLVNDLYSSTNYESLVRTILTSGVRAVTGDPNFVYPENVTITSETADEFLTIMENLTNAYILNAELINDYTQEKVNGIYQNVDAIDGLSIVPEEVYEKIRNKLGVPQNYGN
jgi:hypothetical protein